ncbi:unnamed protein product [Penicillium bialowiezense]
MFTRYIVFFLPLANAWTFRYTNDTNETEIIRGTEERNCTIANISEEKLFTWDPEGSNQCVSIYRDATCDSMGGYSSETSTIASTSTATSTSASTSASTTSPSSTSVSSSTPASSPSDATAASTSSNTSKDSSAGLSGGAIAGIVIGVVAAVAIIIGLVVFFMKRQKKNVAPIVQPNVHGPYEADGTGSTMSGTTAKEPITSLGFRPVPGSRFVELKGDEGSTELGSSPISELDGGSAEVQPRRF